MTDLSWTYQDDRAVDIARVLAADAVEKAGNGHPGTAISLAPLGYLLYQKVLKLDVDDEMWIGRDRFLLSAGHASLIQYCQFYLAGLGIEMSDLEALRTFGSKTPAHPEYHHTRFVEATTGPLGAGVSMAVGMAMAARRERALYEPNAVAGHSLFDRFIYAIASDGDMEEGISSEASSLAGTQQLGNLILFYDDNRISIEGETKIAFTEDVAARYRAYGWHVQEVDWTHGGSEYREDVPALYRAILNAQAVTERPSLIRLTTVIGWPLPTMAGTAAVHGAKLGRKEVSGLKQRLGFPDKPFTLTEDDQRIVETLRHNAMERGRALRGDWNARFAMWQSSNPGNAALLERVVTKTLPAHLTLPSFPPGTMSTRAASGEVLTRLADQVPELWGGSADLASSNNTTMKGEPSFFPAALSTREFSGDRNGRTLHFGIREHAMGGILNGINLSGLTRAYGGTFFVFSDYMRPPVRLAAIMELPTIFVWTHDSIGVGEDGPTHQPIEQLAAVRAIPGLDVVRPADANETVAAWLHILDINERPCALLLTRQSVPVFDTMDIEGVSRGAYVMKPETGELRLILIATGSEVQLALGAQEVLQSEGIGTRVVSMPCQEWFDSQDADYRDSVLPASITARVSIEAGIAMGWQKYVGNAGRSVSIEHFGASASGEVCFEEFGFTIDHVVEEARLALV